MMAKKDKKQRLGKLPKKKDARNFQLATYTKGVSPPPNKIDHASRLVSIGDMANDVWNSCTVSTAGHMVQSWTVYAERGQMNLSDAAIIEAYKTIMVGNDGGAYSLDALNMWRKRGIDGEKIEAFIEIAPGDLTQAKLAVQYFGSLYVGLRLPDQNLYGPWTTVTGIPKDANGHVVNICGYNDSIQMFTVCTWGRVVQMSYAWFEKYSDEGYAVADDISLIESTGKTPEGFDWATLMGDLYNIDNIIPDAPTDAPTDPAPAPTPTPEKSKSKVWLIIGVAAAVLIIGLIALSV